ncbi:hypothetical protein ACOTR2_00440 (plasmid) [Enterobacter asburiae]|uniref:hypothetical protein n=1 Tax=Enterobacter TaxID=547 RepID=UPI002966F46C|nr:MULTISPECIES: hypothetical protein [Enterobacter]MDW3569211.1 hypothetical protein [Enterobacter asburiae]MDW3577035.1 hypothetical protein [Enterobacter asburiae]
MKILFPLTGIFLLTGCVVADMDSTNYEYVPYIQTIQKAGHIGHTDREQRKRDLYACGVNPKADLDYKYWQTDTGYPNQSLQQIITRREKIEGCMKSKGYVLFDYAECGPLKALTGLCN